MIPVAPAAEPPTFDAKVRQKGRAAMLELVGRPPKKNKKGRPLPAVAKRRDQIPSDKLPPYWREVIDEMRTAYGGLCAYLAMYIEPATGNTTIDHVVPRSQDWRLVYEWSNYRLAAALINSKKGALALALDPFAIRPGMFGLEYLSMKVVAGPAAKKNELREVDETISTLGLNHKDCVAQRSAYVHFYQAKEIALSYLTRRAPFLASELRRQGKLNAGDV